jgi:hypothetical protein
MLCVDTTSRSVRKDLETATSLEVPMLFLLLGQSSVHIVGSMSVFASTLSTYILDIIYLPYIDTDTVDTYCTYVCTYVCTTGLTDGRIARCFVNTG